ncbi:MAG: DUF4336 domain-containing protein [Kofleriaceae bacterium]
MQLLQIGPDLWRAVSAPIRLPGGARMPVASTIVRLPDRTLAVYSPIAFADETAEELAGLGEVAHLIAPNLLHHLYLTAASSRWPAATVHAPTGLVAKRPDLRVDRTLDATCDPAWGGALDAVAIGGAPTLTETVLFHQPTGTLLCGDLVFNLPRPAKLASRIVFSMMGVSGRLAQSRAWKMFAKDRSETRAARDRILAWPIRAVAPCHGDVIASDPATLASTLGRMG